MGGEARERASDKVLHERRSRRHPRPRPSPEEKTTALRSGFFSPGFFDVR